MANQLGIGKSKSAKNDMRGSGYGMAGRSSSVIQISHWRAKQNRHRQETTVPKNWMTTAAGVATLLATVAKILSAGGAVDTEDIATITSGIGLLAAKDFNKSHTQP